MCPSSSSGQLIADWISAVFTAIAAIAAAYAAHQAKTNTNSVGRIAEFEYVNRLADEFSEHGYFVRFWTISRVTRDIESDFLSMKIALMRDTDAPEGKEELHVLSEKNQLSESKLQEMDHEFQSLIKSHNASETLRDAIGPPYSQRRGDVYSLYYFALRLITFCLDGSTQSCPSKIALLNDQFGVQLINTLSAHRRFAARLHQGTGQYDLNKMKHTYDSYGLKDARYAELIDLLAYNAHVRGWLQDNHRKEIAKTEQYLASHPVDSPARQPIPAFMSEWLN